LQRWAIWLYFCLQTDWVVCEDFIASEFWGRRASSSSSLPEALQKMDLSFIAVTPSHHCRPELAIAAVRAGEFGILDLGGRPIADAWDAIESIRKASGKSDRWGIRWETAGVVDPAELFVALSEPATPYLVLSVADYDVEALKKLRAACASAEQCVFLEVYDVEQAIAAEQAGFDGVVLKGHEAGGRVSRWSSFLLLQKIQGTLRIPFWLQGGIGPQTAAAARFAGAAGVVLSEQLWLTKESSCNHRERAIWQRLDGSETVVLGAGSEQYRYFNRSGRDVLENLARAVATGDAWQAEMRRHLDRQVSGNFSISDGTLVPLGQDIAFAATLAEKYGTVGRIINAMRLSSNECIAQANVQRALGPGSPLAANWKTQYPIAQGPMTRVSDVTRFATCVAEHGAMPFLALALLRGPQVRTLLAETKKSMGDMPWGVGILGFVPAELRKEQLPIVLETKPNFAIIAGGRPSQAAELEQQGIATYLHVPSPGLLETFLRDGSRKFIFEGRECGGHVGPRTSFLLWQSAINMILSAPADDLPNIHILFAGGIHDSFSAALVSVLAAPLVERGVKIGVLMGTSYLFTPEAVESGAITAEFQRQAIQCRGTALLESGAGHATRCVPTPFVDEFQTKKRELVLAGKPSDEIRLELEMFNIGRLRLASKGLMRRSGSETADNPEHKGDLAAFGEDDQRRMGMYMIGDVATLREKTLSMRELHEEVTTGCVDEIARRVGKGDSTLVNGKKKSAPGEPLAVVGMGCMLPDSPNVRRYWENIIRRFDAIREVPPERWRIDDFYSADRLERDRVYSKWGSFLDDYVFDPFKYRIPPAALANIEPIQLLALEVAEQALEDAGYCYTGFPRERTAVIFGAAGSHDLGLGYAFRTMVRHHLGNIPGMSEEQRQQVCEGVEEHLPEWSEDSFAGFLLNVVAGRIANRFDLRGPNFTVDAACASSIAALQTAIEQLRAGKCDAALVGAVDGTNNPFCFMSFAKTHALSPQGKSRPYDKDADGIGLGEGLAAIVLKRLSDAERDGDKIYCVITGIGSSSDGRNRSMTAPFPDGQVLAIRRAHEDAGIDAARISLVEAHSTGTSVGDRVELEALQKVFPSRNGTGRTCAIGSVKSNIGHTKTTAGLSSLIKTAIALDQKVLPATIGVKEPNEQFDTEGCPFYVNTDNRPWLADTSRPKRCAGLSAFGFGGTNFHVVMEEYDGNYHAGHDADLMPRDAELFVWQAHNRKSLFERLATFSHDLAGVPTDLAQLAYSVHSEMSPAADATTWRCVIVATSADDLREKLKVVLTNANGGGDVEHAGGAWLAESTSGNFSDVCFLFPSQGSQSLDMLGDLVLANRWSYGLIERADRLLDKQLPVRLSTSIYPLSKFGPKDRAELQTRLNDTRVAQPALGLAGIFACELLRSFNIQPAFAGGHSYGEYVALWTAGVLGTDDLFKLSAERGRLAHEASQVGMGAMAAVFADAETTSRRLHELGIAAELANLNADDQTVISGPATAIDDAIARFSAIGLVVKKIPVTAAFHTSALEPAAQELSKQLEAIEVLPPKLPVFSNTTAQSYSDDPAAIRRLLTEHLTKPVRFIEQISAFYEAGARTFIEVGPGSVLTRLVGRILKKRPHSTIALDGGTGNAWTQFGKLVGQLFVAGKPVDTTRWFEQRGLRSIGVRAYLDEQRAKQIRKPTDWLVSPSGARPAVPSALNSRKRPPVQTAAPSAAPKNGVSLTAPAIVAVTNGKGSAKPAIISRHASTTSSTRSTIHQLPRKDIMPDDSHENHTSNGNGHSSAGAIGPARVVSQDALAGFQQTMSQWLDLQKDQLWMTGRFLDLQENLMRASNGLELLAAAPSNGAPTNGAVIDMRPVVHHQPPVGLAVVPPPKLPPMSVSTPSPAPSPAEQLRSVLGSVQEQASSAAKATNGAVKTAAVTNGALTSMHREAKPSELPNGSEAPSVERFRKDLLDAVSQRTGYPIDMLDENAALEAELGIDSIKTVEIFSSLTTYHAFLPGGDENQEETLATFSRMKTLRDIISVYEQRRSDRAKTNGSARGEGRGETNGHHSAGPPVERFTIDAALVSENGSSSKKKTSPGTIYS
jgi:acyl transferase domain-containing protein/NAD(P)H-dependent flavin oxidoreductase YrpB (nitropropane dioxygenase family)